MNKDGTYKNVDEFVKKIFPDIHKRTKSSDISSLESFIKKSSEDFKLRMDHVIKDHKNLKKV